MLPLLPTTHGPETHQGHPARAAPPPKAPALHAPKTVINQERNFSNPSTAGAVTKPNLQPPCTLKALNVSKTTPKCIIFTTCVCKVGLGFLNACANRSSFAFCCVLTPCTLEEPRGIQGSTA